MRRGCVEKGCDRGVEDAVIYCEQRRTVLLRQFARIDSADAQLAGYAFVSRS